MKIANFNPQLAANRWYVVDNSELKLRPRAYPSPHTVYRRSTVDSDSMHSLPASATQHIRAAAVFPGHSFCDSVLAVPYALIHTTRDWTMVIVSVADRSAWIAQALDCGACAVLRSHNQSTVYHWEPEVPVIRLERNYSRGKASS